jgi:hypothetical protein
MQDGDGRFLNPFPHIENLDRHCSLYLIEANRIAKAILEIPFLFALTSSKGLKPAAIIASLMDGKDATLKGMIEKFEPISTKINALRNFQEHTEMSETKIFNFSVKQGPSYDVPTWEITGKTKYQPSLIGDDMQEFNKNLFHAAEGIFMHCLLCAAAPSMPYLIESVPNESIDPDCPIKYKLSMFPFEPNEKAT